MAWPASIFWVAAPGAGRLAVIGRPRSEAAFAELKQAGIDVIVSLLEAEEAIEVGLGDEASHCQRAGITFVALPVTDHGVPGAYETVEAAVAELRTHLDAGAGVGAHCFAGLGRSPTLVAAVLIHGGMVHEEAIRLVSEARGFPVPETAGQHAWLEGYHARRRRERGG